ncbi:MAG: hypothetical protein MZW92_52355 [Comamonadaceae bacterium]|nr:hypothetical protein [Comamonadaceae bacterium]
MVQANAAAMPRTVSLGRNAKADEQRSVPPASKMRTMARDISKRWRRWCGRARCG